jgi:hypothetical protein
VPDGVLVVVGLLGELELAAVILTLVKVAVSGQVIGPMPCTVALTLD